MYAFLNTLIQVMLVTEETESLLLDIITFVGGNLMTWSKKQDIVSRSSAEEKYRVMAHTTCEMVWLKNLLMKLDFRQLGSMPMHCDNQSAIYIAQNQVFHERTRLTVISSEILGPRRWYLSVHSFVKIASRSSYQSSLTPCVFLLMKETGHIRYL